MKNIARIGHLVHHLLSEAILVDRLEVGVVDLDAHEWLDGLLVVAVAAAGALGHQLFDPLHKQLFDLQLDVFVRLLEVRGAQHHRVHDELTTAAQRHAVHFKILFPLKTA